TELARVRAIPARRAGIEVTPQLRGDVGGEPRLQSEDVLPLAAFCVDLLHAGGEERVRLPEGLDDDHVVGRVGLDLLVQTDRERLVVVVGIELLSRAGEGAGVQPQYAGAERRIELGEAGVRRDRA